MDMSADFEMTGQKVLVNSRNRLLVKLFFSLSVVNKISVKILR